MFTFYEFRDIFHRNWKRRSKWLKYTYLSKIVTVSNATKYKAILFFRHQSFVRCDFFNNSNYTIIDKFEIKITKSFSFLNNYL